MIQPTRYKNRNSSKLLDQKGPKKDDKIKLMSSLPEGAEAFFKLQI